MRFEAVPSHACWRHRGVRDGFEVVHFAAGSDGLSIEGHSVGVQDDEPYAVRYRVHVDPAWRTRSARLELRTPSGTSERALETDGQGRWAVDGRGVDALDGCLDVDLECSAMTNMLPVRRLALVRGDAAIAPAAYVTLGAAGVEPLEQRYARIDDDGAGRQRYDYVAPTFDFQCTLVFDAAGLVVDYPQIAERVR